MWYNPNRCMTQCTRLELVANIVRGQSVSSHLQSSLIIKPRGTLGVGGNKGFKTLKTTVKPVQTPNMVSYAPACWQYRTLQGRLLHKYLTVIAMSRESDGHGNRHASLLSLVAVDDVQLHAIPVAQAKARQGDEGRKGNNK